MTEQRRRLLVVEDDKGLQSQLRWCFEEYEVLVAEEGGSIVFLHQLAPGAASQSYGIQVARLAGVPQVVVDRAREVLENLEAGSLDPLGFPKLARHRRRVGQDASQMSLFDKGKDSSN